jgi:hypothetical protein
MGNTTKISYIRNCHPLGDGKFGINFFTVVYKNHLKLYNVTR